MTTSRLFIGTLIDYNQLFDNVDITRIFDELKHAVKPVISENLHLTWQFLGNIDNELIPILEKELGNRKVIKMPINIIFDSIEIWPKSNRPSVLVLKSENAPQEFYGLSDFIAQAAKTSGIKASDKQIVPHITIARFKRNIRLTAKDKRFISSLEYRKTVDIYSYSVIQSIISEKPAMYELLKNYTI